MTTKIKCLSGMVNKAGGLLCPIEAIGLKSIAGAVSGAYGVKSARNLSRIALDLKVFDTFNENRDVFECRIEVPVTVSDKKLFSHEMITADAVHLLNLRSDAMDAVNEIWKSYFPEGAPAQELNFPRTPTEQPHLIPKLRTDLLTSSKMIIFPVLAHSEVIVIGAFFDTASIQKITITM